MLFDRFDFFDMAIKVVGVGSVGTMCGLGCSLPRTTIRCSSR
ncbi:hypothetical protein D8I24_4393 [Cupriavidus necator H850]|nr:hypothetical protein D8I24_4393 [Cupriavidus necator H850]